MPEAIIHIIIFFLAINIPPFLIIVVPILFTELFLKKGKKSILKISTIAATLFAVIAIAFNILFPTAFPYVDWWILGKTPTEVDDVYEGEWTYWPTAYYQRAPHSWSGYYYIECGDDNRVYTMGTIDAIP